MWVVLIFSVTSWCYGMAISSTWWPRLPDLALATLAALLVHSFARLGIPHHSHGPALGAALVLLAPRVALLPFDGRLAAPWFLAAAVTLISAKIYLRDGAKSSSFALLGICLGGGLAIHPAFLAILPWSLLPAIAVLRGRQAILKTLPWMSIWAFAAWFGVRWGSATVLLTTLLPPSARDSASASVFTTGTPDALHAAMWTLAILGLLLGIRHGRRIPAANSQSDRDLTLWNAFWRLTPLFEMQLAVGLLTAAAWIFFSEMFYQTLPTVEELLLLSPLAALAAGVGFANATDWLRRQRRVPNWLAEHPTAWGLLLLCAANLLQLLRIAP